MTFLTDAAVGRLRDVAVRPALPSDRYALGAALGRGGMGTVYAAVDRLLDREVALKVSNAVASGGELDARLGREARVLASLEHPGIVPIHDAGTLDDGRIYYVMKLVRGDTLAERADELRRDGAALSILERVVETVAFAHARGVVHRDLKPSNIMLGSFGEVLVLDWGVARVLNAGAIAGTDPSGAETDHTRARAAGGTEAGTRIGTEGFMSPEQQRGDAAEAGPASDVFSLGALAWWLLAGAVPPASLDAARRRFEGAVPRVPKRLRAIVLKCLAARPEERYADAGELVADLARYRAGRAVSAHRETPFDRLGRWFVKYRAAIVMVAAYLVMRTLFALFRR